MLLSNHPRFAYIDRRQLKEMDKSEGQKDYRRAKALALAWSMAPFPFDRWAYVQSFWKHTFALS